ncbi:hypothetical protein ABN763_16410 [Spongiivirga sp. MCCC 1A20706]|uniref:hypothetical protein n=1 Tax=Spongiivirga sp. MCCC 1A20706 TaxID=3160963 RepID=UPI00397757F4
MEISYAHFQECIKNDTVRKMVLDKGEPTEDHRIKFYIKLERFNKKINHNQSAKSCIEI